MKSPPAKRRCRLLRTLKLQQKRLKHHGRCGAMSDHLLSCISAGADVSRFRTTVKWFPLNTLLCIPIRTFLLKALLSGSQRPN